MELHGQPLPLNQIAAVANGTESVRVSESAHQRIIAARGVIDRLVADDVVAYGVTTGFGKLADVRIPRADLQALQLNLVRSHACGIGRPLSEPEVRAMM